jgi:hypothetical protein
LDQRDFDCSVPLKAMHKIKFSAGLMPLEGEGILMSKSLGCSLF